MKQIIAFLALIFSYMLCGAQATTLVVDNQTPGWLSSKINYGDQQTVENLTVTGYINAEDFDFINELNSYYSLNGILDLENVHLVKGGDSSKSEIFANDIWNQNLTGWYQKVILPNTIKEYGLGDYGQTYCCTAPADTVVVTSAPISGIVSLYDKAYAINPFYILPEGVTEVQYPAYRQILLPTTVRKFDYTMSDMVLFSPVENPRGINAKFDNKYFPNGKIYVPKGSSLSYHNSDFKEMTIIEYGEIKPSITLKDNIKSAYVGDVVPIEINYDSYKEVVGWTDVCVSEISSIYDQQNSTITFTTAGAGSIIVTPHTIVPYFTLCNSNYDITIYDHTTGIECPKNLQVNINEPVQLNALTLPIGTSDGKLKFNSSNPTVASISQTGLITPNAIGKTNITVESIDGNITVQCLVEVIQPVESIIISPKAFSLKVGESTILESLVLPYNASNKTVEWQSSNETIATVDNNGKVTAIEGGEAKIIIASSENPDIKDECAVTIIQPVAGVVLNKSVLELTEDEYEQLTATITPDNASNKSVNWTSSDVSVAMVSPDGTVYAIKAGQTTIMATTVDGGFVALCKVIVKSKTILAESLSLSRTNSEMTVGGTLQLSTTVLPENTTNKNIQWTSTNTDVATVTESGFVSAINEGDVQIIASTTDGSNLSAVCEIAVNSQFVPISQITIIPSYAKLAVGETLNVEALIAPTDATNKNVNWSSTNSSVTTVDSNGQLTAKGIGTAMIIASSQDGTNISATCAVVVDDETSINNIENASNDYVKIYNLQGILVYEGEYSKLQLSPGTYIIISQGNSFKKIIR